MAFDNQGIEQPNPMEDKQPKKYPLLKSASKWSYLPTPVSQSGNDFTDANSQCILFLNNEPFISVRIAQFE